MLCDNKVRATIPFKLRKRGNWGSSHTAFDNLKKGFKDGDLGNPATKRVDKLARELVRQGWIPTKPTHYGQQVSLNPREHESIIAFMKTFFPEV